jgi:hypothetical protein
MSEINFEGRFSVSQYPGIAFYLLGWEQAWEPQQYYCIDEETGEEWLEDDPNGEGEWIDNPDGRVRAVMVGDDRIFLVDTENLTEISDEEYCSSCGQIGCCHN